MDKNAFMEIQRFQYFSGAKILRIDTLKRVRNCFTLLLGLISPRRESESEVPAQLLQPCGILLKKSTYVLPDPRH